MCGCSKSCQLLKNIAQIKKIKKNIKEFQELNEFSWLEFDKNSTVKKLVSEMTAHVENFGLISIKTLKKKNSGLTSGCSNNFR